MNLIYLISSLLCYVQANTVMPWMYVKNADCGGLLSRYDYIMQHKEYFTIVAPTVYYVSNNGMELDVWGSGCNGTSLEQYSMEFPQQNIEVYPHIAYDSINITSLRKGILNNMTVQETFLNSLLEKSIQYNYTGYSLDLFPSNDELGYISIDDGEKYAELVERFAKNLHEEGKKLRVYAEPGDMFSNIELLGKTSVDLLITQAYEYSIDVGTFRTKLYYALQHVNRDKLGIGLCPSCLSSKTHFTSEALEYRFQELMKAEITNLGIWCSGVPEDWLPYLLRFLIN
jgi:hypothetical protein